MLRPACNKLWMLTTELLYVYVCGQSGGEVVDKVLSSVLLKRTVISVRLSDFLFD